MALSRKRKLPGFSACTTRKASVKCFSLLNSSKKYGNAPTKERKKKAALYTDRENLLCEYFMSIYRI